MKTYLNKRFSKCSAEQEMVINGMNVWKCLEVYGIYIWFYIYTQYNNISNHEHKIRRLCRILKWKT